MDNASSGIKIVNIYQTLGKVFHHIPNTLNCIKNTGLCCAIIWTLFSVFENVLNCCRVCYSHEIEVKVMSRTSKTISDSAE